MQYVLNNKKIFIALALILLIPIIIPLFEILVNVILTYGRIIGTNVRYIEEGICLK